jgi:hypothetical protein
MSLIILCLSLGVAQAEVAPVPATAAGAPGAVVVSPLESTGPSAASAQGGKSGAGGKEGGGGKGQGQGKGKGKGKGKAVEYPYWQTEPYLTPEVGASAYSSGGETSTAVTIGGQAGIRYLRVDRDRPWLTGKTRLAGAYMISGGGTGYDVRLGSFIGPQWESVNLQVGPDVFYNQYQWDDVSLEPTIGVGVPATATRSADVFTIYGGVEPAWLVNEDRRVDWDTTEAILPGFGHEFTYRAGVGVVASFASFSLSYQYKITAYGIEQGFGLGFKL